MREGFFRPVFTLAYLSRSRVEHLTDGDRNEIENILAVSRARNASLGITGALFFNEGCFTQVLEGPESAVNALYERIRRDTRHAEVTLLSTDVAVSRRFSEWSMAFVGTSDAARAHYASFVNQNKFYWRNITSQTLCLVMLEMIAIDKQSSSKGG